MRAASRALQVQLRAGAEAGCGSAQAWKACAILWPQILCLATMHAVRTWTAHVRSVIGTTSLGVGFGRGVWGLFSFPHAHSDLLPMNDPS
jgi:hypothetical protein